jgi:hypothetical protein
LAPDGDFVREEIAQRYISSDPVNANAPPSTGDLPEVAADRLGPGPLPAQGHTPGVDGSDGLTGVRIDELGELVDDRGVPLPAAAAQRIMDRLRSRYGLAAAANALTDETPAAVPRGATGKSAQPGILAAALASVRKQVTSMAAITGCKDSDTAYVQGRGDGHSDELDEGESPAPFNGGPVKSLPASVQKTISALRQVRKASIPLAAVAQTPTKHVVHQPGQVPASVAHLVRKNGTGAEAEADVAAALGGRARVELGTGYNALGDRTPQVRRGGGLSAALQEIDAGRLQRMGNGLGQIAQTGLGDGLTKQGSGAGRLGAGQARVADGAHSGGSGHHGGGKGGGGRGGK